MSGAKRNPDRLNTIGVIVVGICGAVLVYVTIVALEAFYVNDTSEIQTMADYGGQDTNARSLKTDQVNRISDYGTNPKPAAPKANEAEKPQTYRIPIDLAMKLVVAGAKTDPSTLVPSVGRSEKATVLPIFGRPKLIPAQLPSGPFVPAPGATPGATPAGAAPAAGSGAEGAGSAQDLPAAPKVPTGAGTGPAPVGGAGALDKPSAPATPANPPGAPPPARDLSPAGSAAGSAAPKGNGK